MKGKKTLIPFINLLLLERNTIKLERYKMRIVIGRNQMWKFKRSLQTILILYSAVNRTLVCLIYKVKQPKKVTDLRTISLFNVLMQIISKVMANRLKPMLNALISEKQSAFIVGRLLTDNALIAYEINHISIGIHKGMVG